MIPQATLEKMYSMRLHGMANAFRTTMEPGFAHNFTTDELIAHLVDSEWEERFNRRLSRLVRSANFRNHICFEQIDFNQKRNLDKNSRKHTHLRAHWRRKKRPGVCARTSSLHQWL